MARETGKKQSLYYVIRKKVKCLLVAQQWTCFEQLHNDLLSIYFNYSLIQHLQESLNSNYCENVTPLWNTLWYFYVWFFNCNMSLIFVINNIANSSISILVRNKLLLLLILITHRSTKPFEVNTDAAYALPPSQSTQSLSLYTSQEHPKDQTEFLDSKLLFIFNI